MRIANWLFLDDIGSAQLYGNTGHFFNVLAEGYCRADRVQVHSGIKVRDLRPHSGHKGVLPSHSGLKWVQTCIRVALR